MKSIVMLGLMVIYMAALPVQAQTSRADKEIIGYAKSMAKYCSQGQWESMRCLSIMSDSNKVLAANYMALLERSELLDAKEAVKNSCAATTAFNEVKGVTKEAIASAMTECANMIADVSGRTNVTPNANHFQLLFAPIFCYKEQAEQCAMVDQSFSQYR